MVGLLDCWLTFCHDAPPSPSPSKGIALSSPSEWPHGAGDAGDLFIAAVEAAEVVLKHVGAGLVDMSHSMHRAMETLAKHFSANGGHSKNPKPLQVTLQSRRWKPYAMCLERSSACLSKPSSKILANFYAMTSSRIYCDGHARCDPDKMCGFYRERTASRCGRGFWIKNEQMHFSQNFRTTMRHPRTMVMYGLLRNCFTHHRTVALGPAFAYKPDLTITLYAVLLDMACTPHSALP